MTAELEEEDLIYLRAAVGLSRSYRADRRRWPFGAVLVSGGEIVGRGSNQVEELNDASAHAEVAALRAAGRALGRHEFPGSVLYSSAEPCPMCLAACYWAAVSRIVFAATSRDLADFGFQDLSIYTELARPAARRSMREATEDGELREDALAALREWAEQD
jgi:tRNA(Arg) A34 adenosine deaminase TadA